jgi:hypothetical protein
MSGIEVSFVVAGSTATILRQRAEEAGQSVDGFVLGIMLDHLGLEYVPPYNDEVLERRERRRIEVRRLLALRFTAAEIARLTGIPQSTVTKDIAAIQDQTSNQRKAS